MKTSTLAEAKQQDLGVASPADPIFHANQAELYTLVKTLTDNAIRYTPAGSQIDLSAAETPGHIILRIEDNGPGIPPAERSRVFDPFYRILGSGQEGTGLGLSIARTIAERHGGHIELSNSPRFPSGLLVSVYLSKSHLG